MIFGLEQPQIKVGIETIVLNNVQLQPDFLIPIVLENTSPLNGEKTFIYKGDYARFRIQINLFESATPTFEQLKGYEKQFAIFYPHKDGDAVKDRFGNDILFFISHVTPFYLENEVDFDMVELTFNSIGFVDYKGVWNILGYGYQFGTNFGLGF